MSFRGPPFAAGQLHSIAWERGKHWARCVLDWMFLDHHLYDTLRYYDMFLQTYFMESVLHYHDCKHLNAQTDFPLVFRRCGAVWEGSIVTGTNGHTKLLNEWSARLSVAWHGLTWHLVLSHENCSNQRHRHHSNIQQWTLWRTTQDQDSREVGIAWLQIGET